MVNTVHQARRAAEQGVDAVIAQGSESAGLGGPVSTMALVPQVVDTVPQLPVVASGGIADVSVDTSTLYRVYLGRAELDGAIRAGRLTMSGPRTLQRGFGHWFTWSAFAPASRSAQQRRTIASRLDSPHRVRVADALR